MNDDIKNIIDSFGFNANDELLAEFESWREKQQWNEFLEVKMSKRQEFVDKINALNLHLNNGQAKKIYTATISIPKALVKSATLTGDTGEGIGIDKIDDDEENFIFKIEGQASQAISTNLVLTCSLPDNLGDTERKIPFVINADPRDLWKNIPTPQDTIYFKEDCDCSWLPVEDDEEANSAANPTIENMEFVTENTEAESSTENTVIAEETTENDIEETENTAENAEESATSEATTVQVVEKPTITKHVIAASQRGRSHAHEGKPRDDDFSISLENNGWYILTVGDGAGSARFSRKGSAIACETVVSFCKTAITNSSLEDKVKAYIADPIDGNKKAVGDQLYSVLANAAYQAHKAIKAEADKKAASDEKDGYSPKAIMKDYATTLEIAICKQIDGKWFIGTFWVGDGAVAIYTRKEDGSEVRLMGTPDGGEYAGQTRFVTMPEIFSDPTALYQRLRFHVIDDFTALMLMTDGISDAKFETDANLEKPEMWDALWEDLNQDDCLKDGGEAASQQLLNWLDFWCPGNHDDRTIAILK